ncbi:protein phosphatase 2C domain-containing protein [Streptomyces griseorubiginosus]|uniref:protein phosphatase 2C domain-containing protein n=1 Tax=Streptomyces griseorubiginosus TaxID=67304 RepID=UPI0033A7338D
MSQQGGRPTGHEDDWWGQLYDSTDDTGPTPAPDTLDDRFASAAGAVEDEGGGGGEPSRRPAAGVPAPRFPEPPPEPVQGPVAFPPGPRPPGFDERAPADRPPSPSGGRTSTEMPPVTNVPASRRPPDAPRPPAVPPPPPAAPPRPATPPPGDGPAQEGGYSASGDQGDGGSGDGFGRSGSPGEGLSARGDDRIGRNNPGDFGDLGPSTGADLRRDDAVPPGGGAGGTEDPSAQSVPRRPEGRPGRHAEHTHRAEGDWWTTPPPAPDPSAPPPASDPSAPPLASDPSASPPASDPSAPPLASDPSASAPGLAAGAGVPAPDPSAPPPALDLSTRPPAPDPSTSAPGLAAGGGVPGPEPAPVPPGPPARTGPGSTQPNPTPEPPDPARHANSAAGASPQGRDTAADRDPEPDPYPASAPTPAADPHPAATADTAQASTSAPATAPDPTAGPRPAPDQAAAPHPLRTATRVDLPTLPPAPVGFVGSGPPTYDAEPTALPPADPDELDDLVADTVLDGARYGACTLRAVSVRGDSARFRGEPRRDSLLTARFGTGEQALVLVAMATGARATPGAHRAAAEACQWIARAVGRSHARLAQDIGAARRGDLKSGLHRLTDRSLGKLRASAAEQGIDPEEYAATLRCLLLPADPDCRVRVFFGVGDGGLFRLRDGEWHDIEPLVTDVTGEPVVGFGSLPAETPEGDRLTMDLGIPTPPSPYEPAPEPPRAPFRFRASVARPGDTLLMCTGGLAEPLRGEPELCEYLTGRWSGPPPGLAAFLADSQVRVKGYADDRTAAAVWEA